MLSGKAIELLQVLLEETHDKSVELIADFSEDIDLDAIIKAMLTWKVSSAMRLVDWLVMAPPTPHPLYDI